MQTTARLLIPLVIGMAGSASVSTAEDAPPAVGKPAPAFSLRDVNQKARSLAEFKGRRVALLFFCGCSWCIDVAREWGSLQRSGALAEANPARNAAGRAAAPPITVIVGSTLDADGCRGFATRTELDLTQTVLLPDPDGTVVEAYHADPCPRVFVIGPDGVVRYINNGKDDAPRKAPALAIVSRALDALRAAQR